MSQVSILSLEDLLTRWGPPPPTLDAAAITYLCNGLTLERDSSPDLGLRRRQGWKMAQQVLTEVAAVLAPAEPPADDNEKVHATPLPKRSTTAPNHVLTPESVERHRPIDEDGKTKDYSAYLDMLMTPSRTPAGRKGAVSCPSSFPTTDDTSPSPNASSAKASPTTIPSSPPPPTQVTPTKTNPPRPATPTINSPTPEPTPTTTAATTTNSSEEKNQQKPENLTPLHPLLLARLNATWSHLLDLDLASRSVEHRVARDLGALRRLRGAALDALLEELVVHASPPRSDREGVSDGTGEGEGEEHAGVGGGEYTAAMKALEEGDGNEVEQEGGSGLDWEGLARARARVEMALVARGALEYESE